MMISSTLVGKFQSLTDANGTIIDLSAPGETRECSGNGPLQHVLFQVANGLFLLGFMATHSKRGLIAFHSLIALGSVIFAAWSWNIVCAPGVLAWNLAYVLVNGIQLMYLFYTVRSVKFSQDDLEGIYQSMFEPMKIDRLLFKRLISSDIAQIASLSVGEAYAMQNLTKTDRLGLLLSGRVNVISGSNYLHSIEKHQFLDSPEFESYRIGSDNKFKVSIIASTPCVYIAWNRHSLEYLLIKETFLAHILSLILAKDVADKLYAMNEKIVTEKGSHLDIRLPTVTTSLCNSASSIGSAGADGSVTSPSRSLNIRIKDRTVSPTLMKTVRSKSLQMNALKPPMAPPMKRMSAGSIFKDNGNCTPNGVHSSAQRILA